MTFQIAEGDRCKDTQAFSRHTSSLVSSVEIQSGEENWFAKNKAAKKIEQLKKVRKNTKGKDTERAARLERQIEKLRLSYESSRTKFEPHMGFEQFASLVPSIYDIAEMAGINTSEKLLREFEGLAALYLALRDNKSYTSITSTIFLYIRSHYSGSLSKDLLTYVQDLLEVSTPQSEIGVENPWIDFLKNTRDNWTLCKGNRLFGHFSKLFGLFVTLGLCRVSDLTFSLKDYKLIAPDMAIVHGDAQDIITAAMDTIVFFTENIYLAWKTGSFKPFMLGNTEASEMDVEYATLLKWWELARNGNLDKIEGVSDAEFNRRLESLATKLKNLVPKLKGIDKGVAERKFSKLLEVINDFALMKLNSGFRRAPFTIEFFGDSSQGKSTCCEQLSNALLASAGLSTEKGRKYMFDSSKKHWDGARSDMLEFKVDDHANVKETFVENSPCDVIVKVCNNVPCVAPMADLANKGRVWIEPEIMTVTTNVLNLAAPTYSNCPYSIVRRMHMVVDVKVKPEFARMEGGKQVGIDTDKVIQHYTVDGVYRPPIFDDIWLFTIMYFPKPPRLTDLADAEVKVVDGRRMEGLSMEELVNYAIEKFHQHRANQFSLEQAQGTREHAYCLCGIDGCKQLQGHCLKHDMRPHFGLQSVGLNGDEMLREARDVFRNSDWVQFVPSCIVYNERFQKLFLLAHTSDIMSDYVSRSKEMWSCSLGLCALSIVLRTYFMVPLCIAYCIIRQLSLHRVLRDEYIRRLTERNTLSPIVSFLRSQVVSCTLKSAVLLSGAYALAKFYAKWSALNPQGSLRPVSKEDIDKRDAEESPWVPVVKREVPIVTNLTADLGVKQLRKLVENNLMYGSVFHKDMVQKVNALFLRSNVVVIPNHYFIDGAEEIAVDFRKKMPKASGGIFACRLSKRASYLVPNTDLRICYASNGGSFRDLTKHFPLQQGVKCPFEMVYRDMEGEILDFVGNVKPGMAETVCTFEGGTYENLSGNTFAGMCGAVVCSNTRISQILGFHLGGIAGKPVGCYGSLYQGQIKAAIQHLRGCEGVLLTGVAEKFEPQVLGVKVLIDQPLNKKSPLNWMPKNSQVEYLGSCPGYSVDTSNVRVTPISDVVTEVCGVPNKWGPPKMSPSWFGWQKCLENLAVPALPYEYNLLEVAVKDYKNAVLPLFKSELWNDARPLTDHENLNGVPGRKFMDSIKLDTSIGYPLSGPKRRFVEELETNADIPLNRIFTDEIMDEIRRCEACYLRGERAYPIAKACKKDEILAKEKCRIFYGNAIALTFLIRKYYLPLLRVLQMNPLVSECAVGINCHGPEWDEFYRHATQHGLDRLFGGDYGKYDQKLPSQLIIAALRILIDCAKECKYEESDLRVMEALAGDLVYAVIAFNGDLIGLTEGTHISGNSLTVVINGICGSLNLRAFFYSKYSHDIPFQSVVSIMTYGDDNIGSVKSGYDDFNIRDCSAFLAKYGQTYTMPDKESELLPFLPASEFEFLKRKSVFHPDLGHYVGALQDESCFKSLHCFMRSKNSPLSEESASALNIDTALREWFNHGRDHYEKRRLQMIEVAKKANISHMCTELEVTYDERVSAWNHKYDAQSGQEVNLFMKARGEIPMKVVAEEEPVLNACIGEVDLLFTKLYKGVHHFLVVEIKNSHLASSKTKGVKQLKRLVKGLSIINPSGSYMGVLLTLDGYKLVSLSENDGYWEDFDLPFPVYVIEICEEAEVVVGNANTSSSGERPVDDLTVAPENVLREELTEREMAPCLVPSLVFSEEISARNLRLMREPIGEFLPQMGKEDDDELRAKVKRVLGTNVRGTSMKCIRAYAKAIDARDKLIDLARANLKENPENENWLALQKKSTEFEPQSGFEGLSVMRASIDNTEQNITFTDQVSQPKLTIDSEMDATRMLQDSTDAELGNFFSRPLKIREYEWGTGITLAQDFNPWADYFTNPRVINRITNFNLLRAKLHLKVVINGNGFQYGRVLMAYNALDAFDTLSTHSALVASDLVQTSQLPHIFLDPTTSQGGDMDLPFFWHENYLNIRDSDWDDMGRIYLRSINTLRHANNATDKVTISVFAYATDVSLSVLTSVDSSALVAQSGKESEIDEANKTGVISGPASVVAKAARTLSGIGAIKPYAMATAKTADMVGNVAKVLGYCSPPITKAPEPVMQKTSDSLALVNVPNSIDKLTLDDKQELSIDPRIAGLGSDDPLNIKSIACRESYIQTFDWNMNTAPETLLWNCRVTPVIWREDAGPPRSYHLPACAMAALPFKYWTGSMKYRFQIVASAYHKGRLKIVYDPGFMSTVEYNTNYMRVVDISKDTDFTIEVGNGQEFTLLDHAAPGPDSETEVMSSTAYTGVAPGNGTLSVYVVNELTTPNSTAAANIQINVFVSAGEDFEVFVPEPRNFQCMVFKPQAGMENFAPDSLNVNEHSAPLQTIHEGLGPGEQDGSDINKVFCGEAIHSFRPLLKRKQLHSSVALNGSRQIIHGIRSAFPYLRGNVADAIQTTAALAPYNYCNTVLLHWVRLAFQGYRGSIRWTLMPNVAISGNSTFAISAFRNPLGIGAEYNQGADLNNVSLSNAQLSARLLQSSTSYTTGAYIDSWSGATLKNSQSNAVIQTEIPYYSHFRFSPGKEQSLTGVELYDRTWSYRINTPVFVTSSEMYFFCSAGEDFQVYFFTGLPRLYYEASPPAA